MNRKVAEDYLCKTSHPKCFLTTNFDRTIKKWVFDMCSKFLRILVVCFVNIYVKYFALVMFWKRRKRFIERQVMERYSLGGKSTLKFLVKYVKCSLKTIQHNQLLQLLAKSLNTFSYFIQVPYHPSLGVLWNVLKSHMITSIWLLFKTTPCFITAILSELNKESLE